MTILEAGARIRRGELVAFPTETVYGLGADATSDAAVKSIYEAKGRPSTNPLIVHVPETADARRFVTALTPAAEILAKQFWPGPLTMVLPRGAGVSPVVSAGRDTVAIRCPKHKVADALLRTAERPIAAPSANRSGFTSPTTAQHVLAELEGRIPLILDGGPCVVGLESTVIDMTVSPPKILRPGAITREMMQELIGSVDVFHGSVKSDEAAASPGLLSRHYAPRTPAYRFNRTQWESIRDNALRSTDVRILLSFDPAISLAAPHETILLPTDSTGYAKTIYSALREADERHGSSIFVLSPDNESEGLWAAVTDRLRRATVQV